MGIFRLTYVSTARTDLGQPDLDKILATARAHNADVGITGLLAFNGANFMQTIEGEREAVEQLLQQISNDPRHFGLIVIEARAVSRRVFAGWAMHSVDVRRTSIGSRQLNGFSDTTVGRSLPEALRSLYRSFNSLAGAAAV